MCDLSITEVAYFHCYINQTSHIVALCYPFLVFSFIIEYHRPKRRMLDWMVKADSKSRDRNGMIKILSDHWVF